MESMVNTFWKNKRVFLTGHTGFKGSWLSLWLSKLGANVTGYALNAPTTPSLFEEAKISDVVDSNIGDIRDLDHLKRVMQKSNPEIIIHMAAQPLVRYSYKEPVETYMTNVMGTVHVLDAARSLNNLGTILNVTTDKCYENREWPWGYRENEAMGGHDPYSSSKGCAELVTRAYRKSFYQSGARVATARAGNVIGGGDWAMDRLVPDILRAFEQNETVVLRNPHAIRPWQHVLDPLSGYLLLTEKLFQANDHLNIEEYDSFNFGPDNSDAKEVEWLVKKLILIWGKNNSYKSIIDPHAPHEAHYLKLDISKARQLLNWTPTWNIETGLQQTAHWHSQYLENNKKARDLCLLQIQNFESAKTSSES